MWFQQNEGEKFWMHELSELKHRGVQDILICCVFFFSSRRRHTRWTGDWSSDVCSSDLDGELPRPARASGRAREFAIRAALGADRFRIVRQLVLESLILAGLGAAVGWLLARWSLAAVLKLGTGLPRLENVHLDMQVAGFSILVTVVTGIAFGLAPAWFASRVSLGEVLKDAARGTTSGGGGRIRGSFVASELALAQVLLVGATLMLRSFARSLALDPGYVPDHILTASLFMPDSRFPGNSFSEREPFRKAFLAQVVERAAALPGVESAAVVMGMPLTPVGGT